MNLRSIVPAYSAERRRRANAIPAIPVITSTAVGGSPGVEFRAAK